MDPIAAGGSGGGGSGGRAGNARGEVAPGEPGNGTGEAKQHGPDRTPSGWSAGNTDAAVAEGAKGAD